MERATLVITNVGPRVLPEIKKIIESMVDLYNSEEPDDRLLLKVASDEVEMSVVRYQVYTSRQELLQDIITNCPIGMDILPIYE